MIGLLITALLLWLVFKFVPHGDIIVAVIIGAWLLKFFGIIPSIIML